MNLKEIFSDIDKFGLSAISNATKEIFTDIKKTKENIETREEPTEINIKDYVYPKKFECPVCHNIFTSNVVKDRKIKIVNVEMDLRPICEPFEPSFYDIVICNNCGYCSIKSNFSKITRREIEIILKEIKPNFTPQEYPLELNLDMAIERYKLALLNSIARGAKEGQKAFICLKLMWLYKDKDDKKNYDIFAELALKGFSSALMQEIPPIMGLKDVTIIYLLGALSAKFGKKEEALRYLSDVIISKNSSERLKERARDLKNDLREAK